MENFIKNLKNGALSKNLIKSMKSTLSKTLSRILKKRLIMFKKVPYQKKKNFIKKLKMPYHKTYKIR